MYYEIKAGRDRDPHWSLYEVDGERRTLVERHYGDDCDANERRYARERAWNTGRTLAAKNQTTCKAA